MRGVSKNKGQVTLFVILAIVILVIGVAIYAFYPSIKSTVSGVEENPSAYIQNCLEDDLVSTIELISNQGGVLSPEFSVLNDNQEIEYLCYTSSYLENCIFQRPPLTSFVKEQLEEGMEEKINSCFNSMKENYENRGYDVIMNKGDYEIKFGLGDTTLIINNTFSLTKKETEEIDSFSVIVNNNLYELLMIAYNILAWEASYGDASIDSYMLFDLGTKIQKIKKDDGSKVYIIEKRETGEKFQFASRSLVWPPGYSN